MHRPVGWPEFPTRKTVNLLLAPTLALLRTIAKPAWTSFDDSLSDPALAQRNTLERILTRSAKSGYGRTLGLNGSAPRRSFERIEPVEYGLLRPLIEHDIASGGHHFSPDRPKLYERTSGSGGVAKFIPYDKALRSAFDRMFRIWAYDLLRSGLKLRSGRCFMSVSLPIVAPDRGTGGVPLGAAQDTDYLHASLAMLLKPFMVAPALALALREPGEFKDVVVASLLAAHDLEVVSIWNPSYWLVLLAHALRHRERLEPELASGEMTRGGRRFRFTPVTLDRRQKIARAPDQGWSAVWPDLRLMSCWADAEAVGPASVLARQFPGVRIQGKGLLATEAPITVPMAGAISPVPLVNDVYLELLLPDGRLQAMANWREGDCGELVVTSPGGFLRYRLHDQVAVSGFFRATPCLNFQGRTGGVVDLVGEKLSEDLARRALAELRQTARLLSLCPVAAGDPPFYALFCDQPTPDLAESADRILQESPHYRVARAIGQLGPLRTISRPGIEEEWHAAIARTGFQEGNIKGLSLVTNRELAAQLWAALGQTPS